MFQVLNDPDYIYFLARWKQYSEIFIWMLNLIFCIPLTVITIYRILFVDKHVDYKSKIFFSNMFDQRIADGLTDLLAGATGIRTSNIPQITKKALETRGANREARAQILNEINVLM